MTIVKIEPSTDATPADTEAFAAYLASEAEEILGEEVEVKVVPAKTWDEHSDLVGRAWDRWLALPSDVRAEWYA